MNAISAISPVYLWERQIKGEILVGQRKAWRSLWGEGAQRIRVRILANEIEEQLQPHSRSSSCTVSVAVLNLLHFLLLYSLQTKSHRCKLSKRPFWIIVTLIRVLDRIST